MVSYILTAIISFLASSIIITLIFYFLFYRDYHKFFKNETNRVYFEKALIIEEQEKEVRERENENEVETKE